MRTPTTASPRDADLVGLLEAGDRTGMLTGLYDRYSRLAYGLAWRILGEAGAAEDVVQEAFTEVWRKSQVFDPRRGGMRGWLLTMVRNRAIDRLRATASIRRDAALEDADGAAVAPDAWEAVAANLERERILAGFGRLPQAQRRTLELAYYAGMTHVQIADRMQVPLGTVKARLRMGLSRMHTYLMATA